MKRVIVLLLVLVIVVGVGWFVYPRLKMNPAVREAADITTTGKVKSAFALSKRLSAYEIAVATQNGQVTLSGRVPTEIDKEMAENIAKDTTGVNQVQNQLEVDPAIQPSEASRRESAHIADLEIAADLRERLLSSPELKGQNIKTDVQNRVVTLSGEVETQVQKNGAEQVARSISNVSEVTNQLSVSKPDAVKNDGTGISPAAQKDQELAQQVSFQLFKQRDNFSDPGSIKVESNNGQITLKGTVTSRAERALAEILVRQVTGVQGVNNALQVSSPIS